MAKAMESVKNEVDDLVEDYFVSLIKIQIVQIKHTQKRTNFTIQLKNVNI